MYRCRSVVVLIVILLAAVGLRIHDARAHLDTYMMPDMPRYLSVAAHLGDGLRVFAPAEVRAIEVSHNYRIGLPTGVPKSTGALESFRTNDFGLAVLIRAASTIFGRGTVSSEALSMLQIVTEVLVIGGLFLIGGHFGGAVAGLLAAGAYAFQFLTIQYSVVPYYYYWMAPISLAVLAVSAVLVTQSTALSSARLGLIAVAFGAAMGGATHVRALWAPAVVAMTLLLILSHWPWRRWLYFGVLALLSQSLMMAPIIVANRSSDDSRVVTRSFWHTCYVGIGGHPNPYNIVFKDTDAFRTYQVENLLTNRGFTTLPRPAAWPADPVLGPYAGYQRYDAWVRHRFLQIAAERPDILVRNAVLNALNGLLRLPNQAPTWIPVGLSATLAFGVLYLRRRGWPRPQAVRLMPALTFWSLYQIGTIALYCPTLGYYVLGYQPLLALWFGLLAASTFETLLGKHRVVPAVPGHELDQLPATTS